MAPLVARTSCTLHGCFAALNGRSTVDTEYQESWPDITIKYLVLVPISATRCTGIQSLWPAYVHMHTGVCSRHMYAYIQVFVAGICTHTYRCM